MPTASAAAKTAPLKLVETREHPEITIRYAETDDDVIAIHRFLLVVADPVLRCEVDAVKSLLEVIRVAKEDVAIMAMHNDILVGTMGLMKATWWYGNGDFLTDRWHFVLPAFANTPTSRALMDEAIKIAGIAGLEFIHNGKVRPPKNGVLRLTPRAYPVESGKMAG